jgi:hypothetical protein
MSEEQKEKIRLSCIETLKDESIRAKISATHKGKPQSVEHRAKKGVAVMMGCARKRIKKTTEVAFLINA